MLDRQKVESFAKEAGADVFGIAGIDRFDELPEERHPRWIFPEAQSAIVIGRRINRGALRGVEEGTNFQNYSLYGYDWLDNRFTSYTTFQVAEFIEDNRYEAVPLPNLPPEVPPMGVKVRRDQPPPNVMLDMDDAAVRAGLGEIGYPRVLVTPQFGPRQRVQMILTAAELEPDPIMEQEICPRTGQLQQLCPLGAMEGEEDIEICGKVMTVAQIDYAKCRSCKNGARPNRYHSAGKPDRMAAICIRSYIDLLERSGRLDTQFATPFRSREPWHVRNETDLYEM
jgi:epoxyqueuosine reductase